ncbi:MAG: YidC/Oxa1 family membrane protein insertase [Lachnospiraceae bacterium]
MNLLLQLPVLGILDPFVKLLGFIINYIYKFLLLFGITKVAVCIIVFTVVIKLLMLPLTYKQQKFSKVSAKMNPEIQAISEKYKDKKDNASMMKMQEEQQAVYKKYGASPMSGCLPMIVIMIILFALYPVIYSIPTYVDDVQTHYNKIVYVIMHDDEIPDEITVDKDGKVIAVGDEKVTEEGTTTYTITDAFYSFYNINGVYVRKAPSYEAGETSYTKENYVAIMAGFSANNWDQVFNGTELTSNSSKIDANAWNVYAPYISAALANNYTDKEGNEVNPTEVKNEIININTFLSLNIFDKPSLKNITILIPLVSVLLNYLQTHISMALTKTKDNEKKKKKSSQPDPMDSMKTMNVVMPIFSGIITLSLPIGVGIYWITSSIVTIILQLIINIKLKNIDVQEFVDESAEKNKKKMEKYGVHTDNTGEMASVAKTSTKSISSKASYNNSNKKGSNSRKDVRIPEEKRHLSTSSIAAIANIYKDDDSETVENKDE